jgi:pilus assembly protein CpaF
VSLARAPLIERVRERLAAEGRPLTSSAVAEAVRAEAGMLGDVEVQRLSRTMRDELVGLGALQRFVDDPAVTDVLVNAPDDVWVDRGAGLEPVGALFASDEQVRQLATRLAASAGRRLDDASPCVDVRIGAGLRLHAVLPPISPATTLLSLRIPRHRSLALTDLADSGSFGDQAIDWLTAMVASRAAFLISGGTGSGKTTLLAALLSLVPRNERIVMVEDAAELDPLHPHVVRLEARPSNVEGAGAVTLRDLVRHALRMRPDRLVVGEARGEEVVDLLAALNTGHEGGCGTLHANAPRDVPARIAALAALGGMTADAAMTQLASAVEVLVHLERTADRGRQLRQLAVLEREGASVRVVPAMTWAHDLHPVRGAGFDRLRERLGTS